MVDLAALLPIVGFGGLALTVVSWLAIAFLRGEGGAAARLSWTGALGLYAALLAFFVGLLQGALEAESWTRIVLFGFLTLMFASGFLFAVWHTAQALAGRSDAGGGDHSTL